MSGDLSILLIKNVILTAIYVTSWLQFETRIPTRQRIFLVWVLSYVIVQVTQTFRIRNNWNLFIPFHLYSPEWDTIWYKSCTSYLLLFLFCFRPGYLSVAQLIQLIINDTWILILPTKTRLCEILSVTTSSTKFTSTALGLLRQTTKVSQSISAT